MKNNIHNPLVGKLFNSLNDLQNLGLGRNDYPLILFLLLLKSKGYFNDGAAQISTESLKEFDKFNSNKKLYIDLINYMTDHYLNQLNEVEKMILLTIVEPLNSPELESDLADSIDIFLDAVESVYRSQMLFYKQPTEITELILKLAKPNKEDLVFNPFAGYGEFATVITESNYYGIEMYGTWPIGAIRLLARNKSDKFKFINENVYEFLKNDNSKFDLILSSIPFNIHMPESGNIPFDKYLTVNNYLLEKGLDLLSDRGKMYLLLPSSFLTSSGKDQLLRQRIVEDDILETVIYLPSGLFEHTASSSCILAINKKKEKSNMTTFIDGDKFITKTKNGIQLATSKLLDQIAIGQKLDGISIMHQIDIASLDYALSPKRYCIKEFDGVKLGEFLSQIKLETQYISEDEAYVTIRDLKNDRLNYNLDSKARTVSEDNTSKIKILNKSALLIATRFNSLKPTYFEFKGDPLKLSPNITAFEVDLSKIDLEYLVHQLYSVDVWEQHELMQSGSTIKYISAANFLKIKIPVPPKNEQLAFVKAARENILEAKIKELGLEREINLLKEKQLLDLREKKHNLAQHLGNFKYSLNIVQHCITQNGGNINVHQETSINSGITIQNCLDSLRLGIENIFFLVENLENEIQFRPKQQIELFKLLHILKERGTKNQEVFDTIIDYNHESFTIPVMSLDEQYESETSEEEIAARVDVSIEDFLELYNNIIENALVHGFDSKAQKKYQVKIYVQWHNFSHAEITFLNNGKPFSKGIADRFFIKGAMAGEQAKNGIGGWRIGEIANYHGATIEIIDQPYSEFPVGIKLLIPVY
jgi:type I restriction enzyme M protein